MTVYGSARSRAADVAAAAAGGWSFPIEMRLKAKWLLAVNFPYNERNQDVTVAFGQNPTVISPRYPHAEVYFSREPQAPWTGLYLQTLGVGDGGVFWTSSPFTSALGSSTHNRWFWVRFRFTSTTLQAKAWWDGDPEPGAWLVTSSGAAISDPTLFNGLVLTSLLQSNNGSANALYVDTIEILSGAPGGLVSVNETFSRSVLFGWGTNEWTGVGWPPDGWTVNGDQATVGWGVSGSAGYWTPSPTPGTPAIQGYASMVFPAPAPGSAAPALGPIATGHVR